VKVLALTHGPSVGPGVFEDAARDGGHELVEWQVPVEGVPAAAADAVIVFGGAMHPDEDERHGWLRPELGYLAGLLERGTPVLGVCLGHQSFAQEFGARVVRGEPVHGKTAEIEHDSETVYAGLESPLVVGRYHSLVVDPAGLPDSLQVSARAGDVIMGLRHAELPIEGVQFHPESVLTPHGKQILRNFLA
jgi:anthranilate synthase/aminodeoxychorismate synthase-like glutamine amidotransferase